MLTREEYFRAKGIYVGLAFIAIGLSMIVFIGREWLTGMHSKTWEPVAAVIVVSEQIDVTSRGTGGRTYTIPELDFRYRYQVNGRAYESDQLSFKKKNQVDVRDIPRFIQAHPVGDSLTVYYNPNRPEQAIMEPGVPTVGILFILMPAFFVVIGPFILWGSVTGAIVRFCEKRGLGYG